MGPFYCPRRPEGLHRPRLLRAARTSSSAAQGDFPRAYVVAHEVGHHVQNLLGISNRVHELRQRVGEVEGNQLSVRQELQADCFAGVWAHHADNVTPASSSRATSRKRLDAASAIGDDTLQRNAGQAVVPDAFTHGTSEQRHALVQ